MSIMNLMPLMIMSGMKSSSSPMMIMILILMMSWEISILMLMTGSDPWSMIYLIMLFNGGLMIMYLFVISMLPKEKKSQSQPMMILMILITPMLTMSYNKSEKMFNELFNLSLWTILTITSLISLITFMIFLLMMDPFKTIKSSF
uniref:NADH dehydrogenase subunit 6 n=1 Tax=Pentidionis agamae TaxID=3091002 RepID=UPI003001456B|nr:NADH dehydrogenase subunit 6 [Pentidionis agamae]